MSKIIEVATGELGIYEAPVNKIKYGEWFGLNGQPWCAMFVSWCYYMAGRPLGKMDYSRGFASARFGLDFFYKKDLVIKDRILTPVQSGDIVFFDFDENNVCEHVGLFDEDCGDGLYFYSIEGNTSKGDHGSQKNGGFVARRKRKYSQAKFVHIPEWKPKELVV